MHAGTGSITIAAPALATLAAAAGWPRLRGLDPGAVNALSRRTAAVHLVLGAATVGVAAGVAPEWFAGAWAPGTVVAASLLAAGGGFVLTLCGLNTTTGSWGAFNGQTTGR